eukprot:CAMPEP_0169416454 /NCGR_PEP_ID=MMETSP1017-20121227/63124_1 /TAXON_ID=342587 /ORGANISM="Karlodinium micrum, Strain CCMP2283" /LENGTH=41 /DNA_ID= /DNA_START= /DNA_END= /DNA_ORIENTATION=
MSPTSAATSEDAVSYMNRASTEARQFARLGPSGLDAVTIRK